MDDSRDLDCKIYVEANLTSIELAQLLAGALTGTVAGPQTAPTIEFGGCEVDVRVNDEADPLRAQDFPDGFLFFHYALEVYPAPGVPREERVKLTAKLLQALWSRGFAAIAACDYEDELPSGGGYKSRPYPWVRTETSVSSSRAV